GGRAARDRQGGGGGVMGRELFPLPAIVREAEDLESLAAIANAAHEEGEQLSREGLARFRAAGEALIKAKKQCGHGEWLGWREKNIRFSERQTQRYMRLAKSDVTSDLESQWQIISGNAPSNDEGGEEEALCLVVYAGHGRAPARAGGPPAYPLNPAQGLAT